MNRGIRFALAVLIASAPFAARAQSQFSYPNAYGGYTTITPGQPPVFNYPNPYGGFTTIMPGQAPVFSYGNAYGGYTTINPVQPAPNLFDTGNVFGR